MFIVPLYLTRAEDNAQHLRKYGILLLIIDSNSSCSKQKSAKKTFYKLRQLFEFYKENIVSSKMIAIKIPLMRSTEVDQTRCFENYVNNKISRVS